jgi:single-strand DNA-binding protein
MSSEIKVVGNLTTDPELRFTPSGSAVANFTVAETPRKFDRQTNEWKDDGPANFFRCTVWSEYAENVAETLKSGMRVIVTGRLKTQEFKGKDGEKRTSPNNVEVDEVAPSLRYATAVVTKVQRRPANNGGGNGFNGGGNGFNGGSVAGSRPAYENSPSESPF